MDINTERLLLRPWSMQDAEMLFTYAKDPEIGPAAGWAPHKNIEESKTIIEKMFMNDNVWAIELKKSGQLIGCIGYLNKSSGHMKMEEPDIEVGYWIGHPMWGNGYASEALDGLIRFCFNNLNCNTLWGSHFLDNHKSARVMQKCGFKEISIQNGTTNLELGSEFPIQIMNLSKTDWLLFNK